MSRKITINNIVNSLDNFSELIANPPQNRAVSRAIGESGQNLCDSFSALAPWVQSAANTNSLAIATISLVCQPYLEAQGYDQPTTEPPYTGGQCDAIYLVYATSSGTDLEIGGQTPLEIQGPLGSPTFTQTVVGTPFADSTRYEWEFPNDPGNVLQFVQRASFTPAPGFRVAGRVDELPDNCGDPPSELVPGANPAPDPGAFPSGFEPGVGPGGQPFFYVPDIDTPFGPAPIGPNPLGDPPPAGVGGGDGLPGDPEAEGEEIAEISGDDEGSEVDFGEPPEGRVWVGATCELVASDALGNIAGTGPTATVFPRVLGNAALKYSGSFGTNYQLRSKFTTLTRPVTALEVTGAFVHAVRGASVKIKPLSAVICPGNPCEETEEDG